MTRFYRPKPYKDLVYVWNPQVLNGALNALLEKHIEDKSQREEFRELLNIRVETFRTLIDSQEVKKREAFIQYNHFYHTLKKSFEEPDNVTFHRSTYHNPRFYEPVGCNDYIRPSNVAKGVAGTIIGLGILACVGGAVAAPFCLPLALPLIAVGVIAVLAASFYLMGSTYLDPKPLKEQEGKIFQRAAKIVEDQNFENKLLQNL